MLLSSSVSTPPDNTASAAFCPPEKSPAESPVLLMSALIIVSTPAFCTKTVFTFAVSDA